MNYFTCSNCPWSQKVKKSTVLPAPSASSTRTAAYSVCPSPRRWSLSTQQKELVKALLNVKNLLELVSNANTVHESDIIIVIAAMRRFRHHRQLQQLGCKFMAKASVDEGDVDAVAAHIVANGGLTEIVRNLRVYRRDMHVCWYACSTLWNLARVQDTRGIVIQLSFEEVKAALLTHHESPNVVHTAFGALSNMALSPTAIEKLTRTDTLNPVVETLRFHVKNCNPMTTACALMANIAVMDGLESLLCRYGVLDLMYEVAGRDPEDCDFSEVFDRATYINNVLAAIGNMSFAPNFTKISLRQNGVEILQKLRDEFAHDAALTELIDNPLTKLIQDSTITTSSFHMAAKIGSQAEVISRLKDSCNISRINETDSTGRTVLAYALEEKYDFLAHLLLLCGADPALIDPRMINDQNCSMVMNGHRRYQNTLCSFKQLMSTITPLGVDVCSIIADSCNNYELQKTFG